MDLKINKSKNHYSAEENKNSPVEEQGSIFKMKIIPLIPDFIVGRGSGQRTSVTALSK